MTVFAIMRCKKLKTAGSVSASLSHCFRERETPNSDEERRFTNEHLAASSTQEALASLFALLPEKRRKDAVLAVEYLMTASPDWWQKSSPEQHEEFFQTSLAWLRNKYGEDRVFVATIHKDETSPHLSAFVVPLTSDGRLSAKHFIGGREQMSLDQTTYAQGLRSLGLERGVQGSKAHHRSVKSFYTALNAARDHVPELTASDIQARKTRKWLVFHSKESSEAVVQRVNKRLNDLIEPISQVAGIARLERKRAKEMQSTAHFYSRQIESLRQSLKGLDKEAIFSVVGYIKNLQLQRQKPTEMASNQGQHDQRFER